MKKLTVILVLVLILSPMCVLAQENPTSFEDTLQSELDKFDLSPLDEIKDKYAAGGLFANKSIRDVVMEFASGNSDINISTLLNYLFVTLLYGIKDSLLNLVFIFVVVVICGVLRSMTSDKLGDISEICEYVGYIIIVYTLFSTFLYYVNLSVDLMSLLQSTVRIIFPPLLTLMTAIGGISSLGVFKPAMAIMSSGMIEFVSTTIMPVAVFGGIMGLLSGISSRISLEGISDFCNSFCKWLMGIGFTVYAGILSIQGIMASTYDGISIRTAKYAVDSFMPIVGGMMSDTVDSVLGCSLLIKNAIGFTGLLVIASVCILPLTKYITCILAYKLLGGILSTTSNKNVCTAIDGMTNAVTTLFTIVSIIVVMAFITIGLAINAGNTNLMLR